MRTRTSAARRQSVRGGLLAAVALTALLSGGAGAGGVARAADDWRPVSPRPLEHVAPDRLVDHLVGIAKGTAEPIGFTGPLLEGPKHARDRERRHRLRIESWLACYELRVRGTSEQRAAVGRRLPPPTDDAPRGRTDSGFEIGLLLRLADPAGAPRLAAAVAARTDPAAPGYDADALRFGGSFPAEDLDLSGEDLFWRVVYPAAPQAAATETALQWLALARKHEDAELDENDRVPAMGAWADVGADGLAGGVLDALATHSGEAVGRAVADAALSGSLILGRETHPQALATAAREAWSYLEERLRALARSPEELQRRRAVWLLAQVPDRRAIPVLTDLLGHEDAAVRESALRAILGAVRGEEGVRLGQRWDAAGEDAGRRREALLAILRAAGEGWPRAPGPLTPGVYSRPGRAKK